MPTILISYFSQGGSTLKIAEKIAQGMRDDKCSVDLHDITRGAIPDVSKYDIIGIGFPVYLLRVPFNMMEYIQSLPDLYEKPFFVFLLWGGVHIGPAGNQARKALTKKGGKEIGYACYKGAHNVVGFIKRGYQLCADNPTPDELKDAYVLGQKLVMRASGEKYVKPPMDKDNHRFNAMFALQRLLTVKTLVYMFNKYLYRVNKKKCDACKICVNKCPVGNITLDSKGVPRWGNRCISCWYCELVCPQGAIKTNASWSILAPFVNYDLQAGMRDKSNVIARVKLHRGKIKRV